MRTKIKLNNQFQKSNFLFYSSENEKNFVDVYFRKKQLKR